MSRVWIEYVVGYPDSQFGAKVRHSAVISSVSIRSVIKFHVVSV